MTTTDATTATDMPIEALTVSGWMNGAMLTLGIDVGHRVGLFDLIASEGPATSDALAEAGGLSERELREWLGLMTVGGVVSYDPSDRTYSLPGFWTMFLTDAGPMNFAAFASEVTENAGYVPLVVRSIKQGGGISYAEQPDFTHRMEEMSRRLYGNGTIDAYIGAVPGLVETLESGAHVADLGCGSGYALNLLAKQYPLSTFVGYDFSEEALAAARRTATEWGLRNVSYELRDVAQLPSETRFDVVLAFDSIHDQARPRQVLAEARRVLEAGGVFVMVDPKASSNLEENIANPMGPWIYASSLFHCMQVSLAQGGEGLGTAYGEQVARELLAEAGFTTVDVVAGPPTDTFNGIYVASV